MIVDDVGNIVATGRNRIFESEKLEPYISNTSLAHAEINAILALDKTIQRSTLTLYTTTEPCPLCMGALRMAGIVNAVYACRDPWAGCSSMTESVPYLKHKKMRVKFLDNEDFEHVLAAILLEAHGGRNLEGVFFEAWSEVIPVGSKVGHYLFESQGLQKLRQEKVTAREMLETLHKLVESN